MDVDAPPAPEQPGYFGEHFTLDGYGGDPARLDDEALVRKTLLDLAERVGMRPLGAPLVMRAPDNEIRDPGGWSGVLLVVESHITIHTFPRRRFLTSDVYSCKAGMDVAAIEDILTARFALQDVETHFLRRGLRYPARNIA